MEHDPSESSCVLGFERADCEGNSTPGYYKVRGTYEA